MIIKSSSPRQWGLLLGGGALTVLLSAAFVLLMSAKAPTAEISKAEAKTILAKAEAIRSLESAEVSVELTNREGGKKVVYDLKILNASGRRAYVEFLAPAEERGRKMLARGRSYWSTFPDSRRVVQISNREAIGNSAFAMADVFQIDAESDYDAERAERETDGKTKLIRIDLKGKGEDVPYAAIKYWVEEPSYFPVRAQFFGLSGKLLKELTVESRKSIGGMLRPEVSKMQDQVAKGRVSLWRTKEMTARDIPDRVFTTDYLKVKN